VHDSTLVHILDGFKDLLYHEGGSGLSFRVGSYLIKLALSLPVLVLEQLAVGAELEHEVYFLVIVEGAVQFDDIGVVEG
jgi:hypothetical protein